MTSSSLLRLVIALEWLLILARAALALLEERSLSPLCQSCVEAQYTGNQVFSNIGFLIAVAVGVLVLIAASIGVFFFRRWARPVYVGIQLASVVASQLMSPSVVTPWSGVFDDLAMICSGLIIGLMYFSNATSRFDSRRVRPSRIGG